MESLEYSRKIHINNNNVTKYAESELVKFTLSTIIGNDCDKSSDRFNQISLKEVASHDDITSCWIILYDRVYDVTNFLNLHPGGKDVILEHAGLDATVAFRGASHSALAMVWLKDYVIGELPTHEQIYRNIENKKIDLWDLPV